MNIVPIRATKVKARSGGAPAALQRRIGPVKLLHRIEATDDAPGVVARLAGRHVAELLFFDPSKSAQQTWSRGSEPCRHEPAALSRLPGHAESSPLGRVQLPNLGKRRSIRTVRAEPVEAARKALIFQGHPFDKLRANGIDLRFPKGFQFLRNSL